MEMSQSSTLQAGPERGGSRWRAPQPAIAWLLMASLWLVSVVPMLSAVSGNAATRAPAAAAAEQTAVTGADAGATSPFLLLGAGAIGILAFVLGAVLLLRSAQRLWRGEWVSRASTAQGRHGFYFEAFVLWFVLGVVWSGVVEGLRQVGLAIPALDAAAPLLVLPALLWARLRGATWQMLRADLGLYRAEGVVREVGAGVVGYFAKLPLTLFGMAATAWLVALAGLKAANPLHPSLPALESSSGAERAVFWATAVVLAPICEEVLFRGLLWQHFRSLTGAFAWLARPVPAALASGLLFASVHPQGVLATPVLLAEGFAFAMVRDWRGSLIAPITVHALHNAALLGLLGASGLGASG